MTIKYQDLLGRIWLRWRRTFLVATRQDGNISAALQADLRELASGKYSYSLTSGVRRLVNDQFLGSSSTEEGEIIHINSIDSAFGSGWSIAGLQSIVENSDGSILLIDGDGEELLFEAPAIEGDAILLLLVTFLC